MQKSRTFKTVYALLPLLSVFAWTVGCSQSADMSADPVSPPTSSSGNGDEAGSTTGGGTDMPASDADGENKEGE